MGEIYKITNKVNGKCYIGQTSFTTAVRWQTHISNFLYNDHLPLYRAFIKYGVENFEVACLEECEDEELDEREIYYIQKYNSFGERGYNATLGGSGKRVFDFDTTQIRELWFEGYNISRISGEIGIQRKPISDYLISEGVTVEEIFRRGGEGKSRPVCKINLKTGEIIEIYSSGSEAARSLRLSSPGNIFAVCSGEKSSAYGFYWRYRDDVSVEDEGWMHYSGPLPSSIEDHIDWKLVCDLYIQGYSIKGIAKQISRSERRISEILQEDGVKKRPSKTGFYNSRKKVVQLSESKYVACYYSIADASEHLTGNRRDSNINNALRDFHTAHGFNWELCGIENCKNCIY